MQPIVPNQGKEGLAATLLYNIAAGRQGCQMHLFTNALTPGLLTVWNDFVEATFPGYAAEVLPLPANQGVAGTGIDEWIYPPITFTRTGGGPAEVVYGWWIDCFDPVTAMRTVLWCQRFDSPFAFQVPGDNLPIILTPGFNQC